MTDDSTFYIFHFIGIGKREGVQGRMEQKIFGYLMNDFFFLFFFWVAFCQRRGTRSGALVLEFGEDVTGASRQTEERRRLERGEVWILILSGPVMSLVRCMEFFGAGIDMSSGFKSVT